MVSYREPTRHELTVLRRSFDHWGIFDYVLDKEILIGEKKLNHSIIREVYMTTKDNFKMITENPALFHIGMFIGHLKRRSFFPSMAGADLISRVGTSFPFVKVNQTAAALVLYGRDIMESSILEFENLNKNNTIVIILNEDRTAIGLGITLVPIGKTISPLNKRIVIKTIVDAGHYLRNEQKKNVGVKNE